jgi:hypothetical protein
VATLFWNELQKEEKAIVSAGEEVIRLTAKRNRLQVKINRLRKALELLGIKSNNVNKEE